MSNEFSSHISHDEKPSQAPLSIRDRFRGNDFGASLPVKKREIKNEFYGNCDDDVLNWMRNGARDGKRLP